MVPPLKPKQMQKSLCFSNHNGLRRQPTFQRRPRPPISAKVYQIDMQDPFASIDCPSDMDDHEVLAVQYYESALNPVTADPVKFSSQTTPCAVCGEIGHPFRDCKILRNVEYLRTHHIQYCLLISPSSTKASRPPDQEKAPLHLVETVSDDGDDSSVQE